MDLRSRKRDDLSAATNVRLGRELKKRLVAYAEANERTISSEIRIAVRRYLEEVGA